jgi:outer membrane protein assembly factor BamB
MKKITILSLVLLITSFCIAADNNWSQFHAGNSFDGKAASGPDLGIYNTPRFQVGSGLGAGFIGASASAPVVMNNKVYCYSAGDSEPNGAVTAFSEIDGSQLWTTPIEAADFGSWSSPSADPISNSVYMGSGEYVYRLDADTGDEIWSYHLTTMGTHGETYASVVNASVSIVPGLGLNGEGIAYMHTYGSFGGGTRLHAINVADGNEAWTLDLTGQGQGAVAYNPTKGLVYTTVGTEGGWAEGRGGIVAIDAETGVIDANWGDSGYSVGSFEPLSFGGITYDSTNDRVIAGGYDFYDYAGMLVADANNGLTISYTGDNNAPSGDYTPAIGDDDLVYTCGAEFQDGPFVFAIDANTGLVEWQSDRYWGGWNQSIVYALDIGDGTDVIYASDQYGTAIGMFDADTGVLLEQIDDYGGQFALANGNLYTISDSQLVAFGPTPCDYKLAGDINGDCKVDFLDFAVMSANWLVNCNEDPCNPACIYEP